MALAQIKDIHLKEDIPHKVKGVDNSNIIIKIILKELINNLNQLMNIL